MKLHMQPSDKWIRKFIYFINVVWPRPPPGPYNKILKTLLLQNHWVNCLESWCVPFGWRVLQGHCFTFYYWTWTDPIKPCLSFSFLLNWCIPCFQRIELFRTYLYKWWPWVNWSILRQGQIWFLRLWNTKHWKSTFFWWCYALYYENAFEFNPVKLYGSRVLSDLAQRSFVHHLSIFSKDFSCETIGPSSIKFNMQPPDKGRKKVYIYFRSQDQDGRHAHIW